MESLRGQRDIVLKARQFGFSTLLLALIFCDTINHPHTNSMVVAHDTDATEGIFRIVRRFYDYLPDDLKPITKYASKRELYFEDRNSRIQVATAGKGTAGRSYTIHNLLGSEVAFWPGGTKLLTGLLNAVPRSGFVALESTANGTSGDGEAYHTIYEEAGKGINGFRSHFYAWWEHEEYESDTPVDFARTDDERSLSIRLDLDGKFGPATTDRKLYWRRLKKAEPGMGAMFAQEYPSDDEEAFLAVTDAYFPGFDPNKHGVFADEVRIEKYWDYIGGYDWGGSSPASFGLSVVDDRARIIDIDERYMIGLTDPEQAAQVVDCIKSHGIDKSRVLIYADPSMWAKKSDHIGRLIANVDAFLAAGLRMVPASNARVPGWSNMKRYLHDVDEEVDAHGNKIFTPFWRYIKGKRPNLCRTIVQMTHDDLNREDLDTDKEDHACDEVRYKLASRPRPSPKTDPVETKRERDMMQRRSGQSTRKL